MLELIAAKIRAQVPTNDPWTNVYGLARSLLALSLLLTLGLNASSDLFVGDVGAAPIGPQCSTAVGRLGLFCVNDGASLEFARWLSVIVLLVTASGWRPRITGPAHWYIAFSFQANATTVDGGDQLAANLALLLVPITLLDRRKSHWDPPAPVAGEGRHLVGWWCFGLIRIQVAIVYFHAAVGKFAVDEWTNGTALYYWLLHPTFGAADWLRPAIEGLLRGGTFGALLTWGVLALEFMLAAALISSTRWRRPLLVGGLLLHAGIIVLHGLVSFGLVMFAALILFLHPVHAPIRRLTDFFRPRADVDRGPRTFAGRVGGSSPEIPARLNSGPAASKHR